MHIRISIGYNEELPICEDIDIKFNMGDIINVIGNNGSGKSTFYKTISGEIKPISGNVPSGIMNSCAIISDNIKIPEEIYTKDLYALISVEQLESLCVHNSHFMSIVDNMQNQRIRTLSSGQKRILEIASALLTGKKVLILDEAFASLDHENKQMLIEQVKQLKDTIIFNTSHNLEDVVDLGGTVYVIDKAAKRFIRYSGEMSVEQIRAFSVKPYMAAGHNHE